MENPHVYFAVRGVAVAQQRARLNRGSKKPYIPEKTRDWRSLVAWEAKKAMVGKDILTGMVKIKIHFHFEKEDESSWGLIAPGIKRVGDLDNLEKALWDAMNRIVYNDDLQISKAEKARFWAKSSYVEIWVGAIDEGSKY